MESYLTKRDKPPWKRARHWLCFLVLSVMMGALTLYSSSRLISWPLPRWMVPSWSSHFYNNKTTPSPTVFPPSPYFVEYPYQYHFTVDEPVRCQQESPFLVIIIPVPPQSGQVRDIIRSTWGKDTTVLGRVVSYYFLLGLSRVGNGAERPEEQILLESRRHRDILQGDFLDSYKNLTIKTMLMFEWLSARCPSTSYAMKVDSDMFLNVHNLVDMLLKAPRSDYMTGMVARGAQVLRDPNSKWFLPASAFPNSTYPPYALGLGYVYSLDLPKKILEASVHIRAVYIEDVYVGLCMRHSGIPLSDPPGGLFQGVVPGQTNQCYWVSVITTILQSSEQLLDVWEAYKTQVQSGC